jgi:uncharacterized repeat protein (TIGR03803 family)
MPKFRSAKSACFLAIFCLAVAVASHAQTYSVVTGFNPAYGENPAGPVVQGIDGNLYGVAETGGNTNAICPGSEGIIGEGCGSVFRVSPSGQVTPLYEFCALSNCADGAFPVGSLVLASNGNFYGTTSLGGSDNQGTIFEITPAGQLTTLHSFCAKPSCADGAVPNGGLVAGINGNFYGTTVFGGANGNSICQVYGSSIAGCGTVFEITPAGRFATLYSFCSTANCGDGNAPLAGLTLGNDGNFYGTTYGGGIVNPNVCVTAGCGTVFRISGSGQVTTLHKFCSQTNCTDGAAPSIGLVLAGNGQFYGIAGRTFFGISPSGNLTGGFTSNRLLSADGLMQASDGNLYGVTNIGGTYTNCSEGSTCGSIFEVSAKAKLTVLYSFCPGTQEGVCPEGALPGAGLMQATNGNFYGTTMFGGPGITQGCNAHGNGGCGVVFQESLNLSPFLQTIVNFGKAGVTLGVLGNGLTGTTSVTFNGVPAASFTVVSDTFIQAVVPTGATAGKIRATTPEGTLSGNVAFRVIP